MTDGASGAPRGAVRRSKLVALLLRHDPERGGLELDPAGWTDVDALLDAMERLGIPTDRETLRTIVDHGSKPRFELRGGRIRARYGHSVDVDLGYEEAAPPDLLHHGTAARKVQRIRREGITPMGRQLVHLSEDPGDARQVGARHGQPVVLVVDAGGMVADGRTFHRAAGGTWLTAEVPPSYIIGTLGGS